MNLSVDLIRQASEYLKGRIRRTPTEHSPTLSEMNGVPVYLKLENLQVTGSFKIRGAFFRLSRLRPDEAERGIVTCSAGNHGQAVAYACSELGFAAQIYVPATVDRSKLEGIQRLGGDALKTDFPGYDETDLYAQKQAEKSGRVFISPFDDWDVMAGNGGSLAAEITEDVPDAACFLVPVGGGGLAAGLSYLVKERDPSARVVACQLESSPALKLSLERGTAVTELPPVETDAGGLEGGLGRATFSVLQSRIDQVALIREPELGRAMRWLLEEHRYLIEPSSAVTLAACLDGRLETDGRAVVAVLSGRNVAFETIRRLIG